MLFLDDRSVVPSPGLVPGRGCKSLAGVNYSDGDVWRTNPCQSCACIDGQVHCFSQTCPILTCNETVIRKGQCCPVCQTGMNNTMFKVSIKPSIKMLKHLTGCSITSNLEPWCHCMGK